MERPPPSPPHSRVLDPGSLATGLHTAAPQVEAVFFPPFFSTADYCNGVVCGPSNCAPGGAGMERRPLRRQCHLTGGQVQTRWTSSPRPRAARPARCSSYEKRYHNPRALSRQKQWISTAFPGAALDFPAKTTERAVSSSSRKFRRKSVALCLDAAGRTGYNATDVIDNFLTNHSIFLFFWRRSCHASV